MGTACRFRPQRASVRCKDAAEGGDVPPPRSVRRNKACRLTVVTRSPSAAAQVFAAEFGWNHEIADPVPCHGTGSVPLLTVVFARGAVLWYLPAEFWPAGDRRERGADRTNGRICVAAPSGAGRQANAAGMAQTGRTVGSAGIFLRPPRDAMERSCPFAAHRHTPAGGNAEERTTKTEMTAGSVKKG